MILEQTPCQVRVLQQMRCGKFHAQSSSDPSPEAKHTLLLPYCQLSQLSQLAHPVVLRWSSAVTFNAGPFLKRRLWVSCPIHLDHSSLWKTNRHVSEAKPKQTSPLENVSNKLFGKGHDILRYTCRLIQSRLAPNSTSPSAQRRRNVNRGGPSVWDYQMCQTSKK